MKESLSVDKQLSWGIAQLEVKSAGTCKVSLIAWVSFLVNSWTSKWSPLNELVKIRLIDRSISPGTLRGIEFLSNFGILVHILDSQ